jgi:hypothetical protein
MELLRMCGIDSHVFIAENVWINSSELWPYVVLQVDISILEEHASSIF